MFSPRCTYENLQGNQTDGTDEILFFRISEGRLTFLTYLLTYLLDRMIRFTELSCLPVHRVRCVHKRLREMSRD